MNKIFNSSLLVSLLIITVSFLIFYPSFNLGLTGDDWLAFYRYVKHLGPNSTYNYNHLTYFLTPYGAQDILMGFLHKFLGNNASPYYLISFLFRMIAAFSFYPIVKYLTKNNVASFFAILFFSVTPVGLDTTNWVFNMPSYITIALFNLFLFFFLISRETKKPRELLLSGLFYYLSYVTTPIRMHGSLLFILLIEMFWLLQKRDKATLRKVTLRVLMIVAIFLFVRYSGHSQGPYEEVSQRFMLGITTSLQFFDQGRFDFIFYPLIMFGGVFIPDLLIPSFSVNSSTQLLFKIALPALVVFVIIGLFFIRNLSLRQKKLTRYLITVPIAWTMIVALVRKFNPETLFNSQYIFLLLIGGYLSLFLLYLLWNFYKQIKIANAIFMATSWTILAFFFAWWWVPQSIFPTTYRYLIVSTVGVSILLSMIISLGKSKKQQIALFSFLLFLTFIHAFSSYSYFNQLMKVRSQELYNNIWSKMPYFPEIKTASRPIIFYFEGVTPDDSAILYNVITFGFPPHMGILYNIIDDAKVPLVMDSWKETVSAVKDGKSFIRHGKTIDPIPIENVYVLKLEGRDKLIDVTEEARMKLKQELN